MAKRKLSDNQIVDLLMLFDMNNYSPAELAKHFNISASTVSRYLSSYGREVKTREAHKVLINDRVKTKLQMILSGYGIIRPDILISELDKNFIISEREEGNFEVIYVR